MFDLSMFLLCIRGLKRLDDALYLIFGLLEKCFMPRMILLMMIIVCLNGTITLEQPAGSFFEFYPRFRDFLQMITHHGGIGTVASQALCK